MSQVNEVTGELLESPVRSVDLGAAGPVAKRLALAMLEIEYVAKRGRNEYHKYDYATAEDIKAAARAALAKNGLVIIPLMLQVYQEPAGKQIKTMAEFEYVIACEEGTVSVPWTSEAYDTADKGINKAVTGGLKYFLINLLQIPIGDEPDPDGEKESQQAKASQRSRSSNGRNQPRKGTLEWAGSLKTSKGKLFSACNADELTILTERLKDPDRLKAANMLLDALMRNLPDGSAQEEPDNESAEPAEPAPNGSVEASQEQFEQMVAGD
jgi:hypothetical protein